ncbi:Proline-rich receptor-like protein kinase PERK5 [Zea mays]|uniref:non-specific serine/threonine protein kinase n=1 Tax=Zea mays TaxID=4577 RepID=A0A3L6E3M2_MAIZE|nr:Proline-rich receptor-like protein kinase PERK5 [Zea mays]
MRSPAAPGPSHDSLDSSPPAPGFRSYQQTKLAELDLDSSLSPATAAPGSQPTPSESLPPAPTPTPEPAAIPIPARPVLAPYSQPASSSGSPADKSVAGIAAGSAAAGALLIVLLVAVGLYVLAPIWKRSTGRDRTGAGSSGGGGASQHESQKHHSAVQIEVQVTPPPTASSSSWATSSYSHKPDTHGDGAGPRVQPVPGAGGGDGDYEVRFRGAFTYEQLAAATDGFSESSLVGRGGFGDVHVGTVDGAAVAVKRLRAGSQQGDREFQAELRIISRVHHRNLVSLVGYCVGDGGQRLLVYEFVPNLTLHHHLHGEVETVLDWPTRWKIAVGAAKGLAYLHEDCHPRIIHRDIKAANILLDPDFNPKVSDFGMAKFVPSRGDTHIATRIVGTIGYLAPEYATSGRLSEKSDVFSFGVVLLELVTGMSAAMSSDREEGTLVGWARPLLTKAMELHDYDELVDPLLPSFDAKQMACLVRCAAAAVSTSARHRPRMSQVFTDRQALGGRRLYRALGSDWFQSRARRGHFGPVS